MNEMEQLIIQLAEKYKDPDEFIHKVEEFPVPPHEKGSFFLRVGATLYKFSYFHVALTSMIHAHKYFVKNNDSKGELRCKIFLGLTHGKLGDFRKAIRYFEESLEKNRKTGNIENESVCYQNLGNAYCCIGDYKKAARCFESALRIDKERGDKAGELKSTGSLGIINYFSGNFRKALEYLQKSLRIAEEIGDKPGELASLGNFSSVYRHLGDYNKAIEYSQKSLEIAQETGNRAEESKNYGNIGNAYRHLGEFEKAIEYFRRSLAISREIGDKAGESACYQGLGNTYGNLGEFKKAIEYSEKSLKIAEEIGDRAAEAICYLGLGSSYGSLGDFKKAVRNFEKSLEIAEEIGDKDVERIIRLSICMTYYESKPVIAYDYCKHSIELFEMIRENLVEENHMIGYASVHDAYQYMIPLCLRLKKEKEAFDYSERSKSRAFLDLLATTEIKPTHELTDILKTLLKDEEMYLARLREIQTQHLRPVKTSVEPGEIEQLYESLTRIYDKIEELDPEYVFMRRGRPLSLKRIQMMLSSQCRDMVLAEFFITKDSTYIFIISSKRDLHVENVPLSSETLSQYTRGYPGKTRYYLHFHSTDKNWQNLSKYLMNPLSEYVDEGDLIYFVPHGVLHYLPLHALMMEDGPLIKKHPVAYSPSASLVKFCQGKGSGTLQSCASFGVEFEKEAEDVAALFDTKASLGFSASRNNVLSSCSKDIIHFACHGRFDPEDPLSSGVVLYDGILTAREIFDVKFNTELITLSACETGVNQRRPGDELIGLTRAFLYAGASSVVVSLWPVYGPSTREFMVEFYKQLKNGKDKATSLQQAQMTIMGKKKYSHPFFWGPFILVGDWK